MNLLHQPLLPRCHPKRNEVDNRLAPLDQMSFLGLRAFDYKELIQFTWIYDRPVDLDALRRFHHNLGYGLLGRRIERSPLPFARDRWVISRAPEDIDIAPAPRARTDVGAWADERVRLPIDPEHGPSWHLGVLPLEGNGAAVSLVASHTVIDGVGMSLAVADAAVGNAHDLGYPLPGSRSWTRTLFKDARQTLNSVPEMTRALVSTLRIVRDKRQDASATGTTAPSSPRTADSEQIAALTGITVYVDLADWDSRADSLGGTSNALFAGIAARLGTRLERVLDDGTASLFYPVNERRKNDARGNALNYTAVTVDPTHAARDLTEIRHRIKQALIDLAAGSNETLAPIPLASSIPKWVARRIATLSPGSGASAIGCSNVGELSPAANRPDGTDADHLSIRLMWDGVKKATMDRLGGKLFLLSGRVHGKLFIAITACPIDQEITIDDLRKAVLSTFGEFDLAATVE